MLKNDVLIIKKQTTTDKLLNFKIVQYNPKARLRPLWQTRKKPFDVIYCLYKMKHWLLHVGKKFDWPNKITPLSTWIKWRYFVTCGMKTYSESRIELQHLQILKKMMESQVSFCHQSSPVSRKAWMFALTIVGVEKYTRKTCGCGQHWRPSVLTFERRGALVTVEICVLCGSWFSNQFDIVSETHSCDTVGCEL